MYKVKNRIGAAVIVLLFLTSVFAIPMSSGFYIKNTKTNILNQVINKHLKDNDENNAPDYSSTDVNTPRWLDTYYVPEEETTLAGDQNDMGYNTDSRSKIQTALPLYVGEPIDQTVPGRGRTGSLDPHSGDDEDWFKFTVCEGQTIQASITSSENYEIEIADTSGNPVGQSYTADETGTYFVHICANPSAGAADYTISVTLNGQNDAGTSGDAGDTMGSATPITPGSYSGYLDSNDWEDWYSFNVNSGQGIFVTVEPVEKREGDFDIHLYNPSGEMVYYSMYYGKDTLEYPADASGTWKIKIDMFPGWDTSKWPDDYFLYGSGAYELELTVGGAAESPPSPIPQPEIIPVAQTFTVTNDPDSNDDEYAFLAAVPAAVYKENGKQYVSPVVYTGDSTPTHWFGTADDTTQYLLDDWNTYLGGYHMTPVVYRVDEKPIKAAADIGTTKWTRSDTAVLAVDGSSYSDELGTIIDKDATLKVKTKKTTATPGDSRFQEFGGYQAIQMWISKEWGAMTVYAHGSDCPEVGVITTRYELGTAEDWPHPYDGPGDNTNIYFPIAIPGLYWPFIDGESGFSTFEITRYSCDRYKIPVTNVDTSIEVKVTTDTPSYLEVFLVDPTGSVRRPSVPHWNGGPINPIHKWNGDHHHGFEDWRRWEPTYTTEHKVEINYPQKGKWTVIVTPHYPYGQEKTSDTIPYHIKVVSRTHSDKRINAGLSAANGAVLASQMHVPLLYVTEDSVPVETKNALKQLGVKNVLFVNLNHVSKAVLDDKSISVTEINTMQKLIEVTKSKTRGLKTTDVQSDNVITITSFGTEDGYFAPAGLIAAYHGSNVLNIGEVPDAYNLLDKATAWREYAGGWYHGCRAQGHLAKMSEPIDLLKIIRDLLNGILPPLGIDQHLRWWGGIHDEIYNWIKNKGLDESGQEVYIFVAPRDTDIRHPICRVMSGLGSYAGQIPFETPGLDAALISRDILYPAIIYANPGRDVTTSQLMNFPDGSQWTTNDGTRHSVYSTREVKESFSSHGRFYEGHVIWDNWLERMNKGVSLNYYSGHGTGGSGISAQYRNVAEEFPEAELRHENLYDFNWWDGWRGYMYDDQQTKTPRWGGFTWYNAKEPNLYDIIHFKWVDQQLENLHSEIELWMSCTTGQHFGPEIYLEHGSALWYGNAGTGLCPQEDLLDDNWIGDMMINGLKIGQAFSKYVWLHQRDFTAKNVDAEKYNKALYGTSSMQVTNVQVIYGDPTLICYSPEWTKPVPVNP
ncbi:MAG: hypothetical protein DRN24_03895 [Thermoplasmata archaeon]|nr:MAG: hypothetical protein DRN24_03895 [Thermoplasmata archaeon]